MANHGYGYLNRSTDVNEIDKILRDYAEQRFPGLLKFDFRPEGEWHWAIYIQIPGFEDVCMNMWLTNPTTFEWRHGDGDRVVGFIKGALAEHVVATIGGLVGDDGFCEKIQPDFATRNPNFLTYFNRFHWGKSYAARFARWTLWRSYRKHLGKKNMDILNTPVAA